MPARWDADAGQWIMTADGLRSAERAKLALMFEEWTSERDWPPTREGMDSMLLHLAEKLISLSPTRPSSPTRLGQLSSMLAATAGTEESTELRSEIVREFYGDSVRR